jgi:WD40 repeat protein
MGMGRTLAFSPDGCQLLSASEAGGLEIRDAISGAEILRKPFVHHAGTITGLFISADGTRLASCARDRTIVLWDMATGRELLTLKGLISDPLGVLFSPDGTRLIAISQDGSLTVWDGTPASE